MIESIKTLADAQAVMAQAIQEVVANLTDADTNLSAQNKLYDAITKVFQRVESKKQWGGNSHSSAQIISGLWPNRESTAAFITAAQNRLASIWIDKPKEPTIADFMSMTEKAINQGGTLVTNAEKMLCDFVEAVEKIAYAVDNWPSESIPDYDKKLHGMVLCLDQIEGKIGRVADAIHTDTGENGEDVECLSSSIGKGLSYVSESLDSLKAAICMVGRQLYRPTLEQAQLRLTHTLRHLSSQPYGDLERETQVKVIYCETAKVFDNLDQVWVGCPLRAAAQISEWYATKSLSDTIELAKELIGETWVG